MSDRKKIALGGMEKFTCSICGKEIVGYSYNAEPVNKGCCCDDCNHNVVIPARLKKAGIQA